MGLAALLPLPSANSESPMTEISMRQKIAAKYQQECRDKDILPASSYEIQLLIDSAFEALAEPTPGMIEAHYEAHASANTVFASAEDVFTAMIRAAQEGK